MAVQLTRAPLAELGSGWGVLDGHVKIMQRDDDLRPVLACRVVGVQAGAGAAARLPPPVSSPLNKFSKPAGWWRG